MKKICKIAGLVCAVLALTILGACFSSFESEPSEKNNNDIPAGMGEVYLSVQSPEESVIPAQKPQSRTIFPDNISNFTYIAEFSSEHEEPVSLILSAGSGSVMLKDGTWTLIIEAQSGNLTVGRTSISPIVVIDGETLTIENIFIQPILDSGIDGTLSWFLDLPDNLVSAELEYSAIGESTININLLDDADISTFNIEKSESIYSASCTLAPGSYLFRIVLTTENEGATQQHGKAVVVHIYPGLCSTVTAVFNGNVPTGTLAILESGGWLETLYVTWNVLDDAVKYNVYYKGGAVSEWKKIDDQLIRNYGTWIRADIPGLPAGNYDVKVHFENSEGDENTIPAAVNGITVQAHDRSGYAFANGAVPGAYKTDGTPKDGARILYITNGNKETIKLSIMQDKAESEFTGLQNIIGAYEKGFETRPLIIRFIGRINEKKNSPFTDNEGTVMIKGNSSASKQPPMNLTLEGIGNDAVAYGWGIRSSRASYVEIRNLGFMLANTSQKDAVELQGSWNMWVHNCDFFYMKPGSASDQQKGDGSLDIKQCDMITVSYNHFWDSGKSNLLGNGTETPGFLTYHHNWYDHSDSRHPRVRFHQVHVYNNYYDGVAKYGIGATMSSSIFAEGNYFRNTKKPMLISMQGSDIAGGSGGTFSSENGGIIKAFNNYMDDASKVNYKPYSSSNTIEYDAYEVGSADETVPATITAKKGGSVYSNFDVNFDSIGYAYNLDDPSTAKQSVQNRSGRYWGGDFSYTFNNATDDALADDPMPALLAALNAYTGSFPDVQGIDSSNGGDGGDTEEPPPLIDGQVSCSFGLSTSSGSSVFVSNPLFTIVTGNGTKASMTINGKIYDVALKLESATVFTFSTSETMTLTAYTDAAGINLDSVNYNAVANKVSILLPEGNHTIKRHSGSGNMWLIELEQLTP